MFVNAMKMNMQKTRGVTMSAEKQIDPNEEVADLAEAIIRVADAGEKLLNSGLGQRAIVLLLQDSIGEKYINRSQITEVLDALPRLKRYLK